MAEETTAEGEYLLRHNHPTKEEAKEAAEAKQAELDRNTGTLNLTIIGDPGIAAEMTIDVHGLRDRIDGVWRVKTATHTITEQGYSTTIEAETLSRRAAAEMTRRAERILTEALRQKAGIMAEALTWAGTFHAIGARLLREYAAEISLDPSFTIHDREDSADLMNLVRHGLGLSKTESRFPLKGTCLAIYSRCVNAEQPLDEVLRSTFPWCAAWADALKDLFAGYVEAKQRQGVLDYDDLLLYWAQMVGDPALAEHIGGRFDHILVDEYQDTNRLLPQ